MVKNYFKTAFRSLRRNRIYAVINIAGLSVGIAASILIFLVIQFETSFDNFHKDKDHIYRVVTGFKTADGLTYNPGISLPAGPAMRIDFPQAKGVASIFKNAGQVMIDNGKEERKIIQEDNFYYAEPQFFNVFNFDWLAGNAANSLRDPNDAVLTQATAEKFFGNWQNAIGKTISYNNNALFTIKGILKNIPANSDFPLSVVVPYAALQNTSFKTGLTDWSSTRVNAYTFVKLPFEENLQQFNIELKAFAKKHATPASSDQIFVGQSLSEMHFDARFGNYRNHTFSHDLVEALILIGIFLIAIACFNFINLATAQGANRTREIGVRKVLGSNRRQLAFQFLAETALITIVSVFLALIIADAALPFLNNLLEITIELNFVNNPLLLFFITTVVLLVTLLSGLYPSVILSKLNPLQVLQSKLTSKISGGINMRRALVILQFGIAQTLIIVMLVVVSQMDFIKNYSLGFNSS